MALGLGRGVTPPRSQSLLLPSGRNPGATRAGLPFTSDGLGQFRPRLRHSFVKPAFTGVAFCTSGLARHQLVAITHPPTPNLSAVPCRLPL
jgi:hypothetical protein